MIAKNISTIFKYLRQSNALSQSDVANVINSTRFRVARIEKMATNINALEWWSLAKHFSLDQDAFLRKTISFDAQDDLRAFDIADLYSDNAFTGGEILHMHSEAFKFFLSDATFLQLCKEEKINPLYFVNINNPLNINFQLRLLQILTTKGFISDARSIEKYAKICVGIIKGSLDKSLGKIQDGLERIIAYIQTSNFFESNYEYKIFDYQKEQLTWGFRPKEHIDFKVYNGIFLKGFHCQYQDYYLREIANTNLTVTKVSCSNNGDTHCKYTYSAPTTDLKHG